VPMDPRFRAARASSRVRRTTTQHGGFGESRGGVPRANGARANGEGWSQRRDERRRRCGMGSWANGEDDGMGEKARQLYRRHL
jgi:hypothetical protein